MPHKPPPPGTPPAPLPAGWIRVDCHLHTVDSGDAITTLDELADRARAAGLDLGVRIVVGEEISTPDGDVIGLFLTERIPYVLPLAEVAQRIRAQGGLVYVPHPFDPGRSSLGGALAGLCGAGMADVIEVFNAKIADPARNQRAAAAAAGAGLPGGVGSDAHDPDGIGAAYLEMPDFDGPASFVTALAQARVIGEYRDHAPRYR